MKDREEKRREALAFKCPFIAPQQELQNNTMYITKHKTFNKCADCTLVKSLQSASAGFASAQTQIDQICINKTLASSAIPLQQTISLKIIPLSVI